MKIEFELDQEQKHIRANRQAHQVVVALLLEVVKNHQDRVRLIQPETIHIPWIHVKIYGAPKTQKHAVHLFSATKWKQSLFHFAMSQFLRVKSKLGTEASFFSFIIQKIGVVSFFYTTPF